MPLEDVDEGLRGVRGGGGRPQRRPHRGRRLRHPRLGRHDRSYQIRRGVDRPQHGVGYPDAGGPFDAAEQLDLLERAQPEVALQRVVRVDPGGGRPWTELRRQLPDQLQDAAFERDVAAARGGANRHGQRASTRRDRPRMRAAPPADAGRGECLLGDAPSCTADSRTSLPPCRRERHRGGERTSPESVACGSARRQPTRWESAPFYGDSSPAHRRLQLRSPPDQPSRSPRRSRAQPR